MENRIGWNDEKGAPTPTPPEESRDFIPKSFGFGEGEINLKG